MATDYSKQTTNTLLTPSIEERAIDPLIINLQSKSNTSFELHHQTTPQYNNNNNNLSITSSSGGALSTTSSSSNGRFSAIRNWLKQNRWRKNKDKSNNTSLGVTTTSPLVTTSSSPHNTNSPIGNKIILNNNNNCSDNNTPYNQIQYKKTNSDKSGLITNNNISTTNTPTTRIQNNTNRTPIIINNKTNINICSEQSATPVSSLISCSIENTNNKQTKTNNTNDLIPIIDNSLSTSSTSSTSSSSTSASSSSSSPSSLSSPSQQSKQEQQPISITKTSPSTVKIFTFQPNQHHHQVKVRSKSVDVFTTNDSSTPQSTATKSITPIPTKPRTIITLPHNNNNNNNNNSQQRHQQPTPNGNTTRLNTPIIIRERLELAPTQIPYQTSSPNHVTTIKQNTSSNSSPSNSSEISSQSSSPSLTAAAAAATQLVANSSSNNQTSFSLQIDNVVPSANMKRISPPSSALFSISDLVI
jgi:hypothetical protein